MCNAVLGGGGAPLTKHLTNHHNLPVFHQGNGATTVKFIKEELEPFYSQYVACHETAGSEDAVEFPATPMKPESAQQFRQWFQDDDTPWPRKLEFDEEGNMKPIGPGDNVDLTLKGAINSWDFRRFYHKRKEEIKCGCRVCKGISRLCPDFHQHSDCLMTKGFECDEALYNAALKKVHLEKDGKFKGEVDSRWLESFKPNGHFGSIIPAEERSVRKSQIIENKIKKIRDAEKAKIAALKAAAEKNKLDAEKNKTKVDAAGRQKSEIARRHRVAARKLADAVTVKRKRDADSEDDGPGGVKRTRVEGEAEEVGAEKGTANGGVGGDEESVPVENRQQEQPTVEEE